MTSTYEFLGEQQPQSMTVRERMDREPRWVGWKTEQRDGTPTKVPIEPATGEYARSNDPTTWGTLADAEDAAARFALDGVGFMLGGGWAGIDIDGPAEWKASLPKDDVEAHARRVQVYEKEIGNAPVGEWVARIGGYSEFSPNNGIKVIVVGFSFEEENDDHKNGTGLEFYAGTRFFTVTGALLLDSPKVNLDAFRALAACRPSRRGAGVQTLSRSGTNGTTAYGAAALRGTVAELRSTRQGDRNNQLNIAAFTLGQLVEGGELDELEARHELTAAALVCGLGTDEIRRTLDRALEDGKREPRTAPPRTTTPRTTPPRTEGTQVIVPTPTPLEPAWDVPVPFPADNIEGAPSFPSHVLPQVARNVIRAVSSFVEVDEGLVAQNVLGIGSFPIARKVVVIEGAWCEEANLWMVGAADSGERKSATLRVIVKPTREVERERRAEEREQIANEGAALEMLEQQYAAQIKAAAKETSEPDRIAAEIELRETARRLDEMRAGRTHQTRFIVDDVTPEFFGRELADNNPLLFANAEGGLLDNFINRYTNIPNLDLLNQSYSGDDYSPGRSTRNAEPVERPLACFALSPQPVIVAGLATNPILVARGTLSRFLYWFVRPLAGTRSVETQPLDPAAVAAWDTRMRELLSLPDSGRHPYQVRMSAEAVAVMLPYRQHAEKRMLDLDSGAMKAWMNRARGQAQRLACVMHFLEHGVGATAMEVEARSAEAAVALMYAYERHAEIAFDLMNELPVIKRARALLGWLRAKHSAGRELTVRDAHRAHQRWGTCKEFRDVLAELSGRGWIWMESKEERTFFVHPALQQADDTGDG